MPSQEDLQRAYQSTEPGRALRTLVDGWSKEGLSRNHIYHILEEFLIQQRSSPTRLYYQIGPRDGGGGHSCR